jgi:hypothetical protein
LVQVVVSQAVALQEQLAVEVTQGYSLQFQDWQQ